MALTATIRFPAGFRRAWARKARGELVWWLLGFVVFQVGLAVALERRLPAVRDPEYALKRQRLQALQAASPGRPLVLMLGSSRTRLGLQAGSASRSTLPVGVKGSAFKRTHPLGIMLSGNVRRRNCRTSPSDRTESPAT